MQGPDGIANVDSVANGEGKRAALGYGRGDGRLEEIHCRGKKQNKTSVDVALLLPRLIGFAPDKCLRPVV